MFLYYLAQTCLSLAVICFVSAFYNFVGIQIDLRNSEPVEGVITSVFKSEAMPSHMQPKQVLGSSGQDSYNPTVTYNFNGIEYTEESGILSHDEHEYVKGAKIDILVVKDKPGKFYLNGFSSQYGLVGTLSFFGILFIFFWFPLRVVFGAYKYKTDKALKKLIQEGRLIQARIALVEASAMVHLAGSLDDGAKKLLKNTGIDPWIIFAQWQSPENQKTYDFQSKGLTQDPKLKKGDYVNVYIDPKKPERYIMKL